MISCGISLFECQNRPLFIEVVFWPHITLFFVPLKQLYPIWENVDYAQ
jgi:hypothetical protein